MTTMTKGVKVMFRKDQSLWAIFLAAPFWLLGMAIALLGSLVIWLTSLPLIYIAKAIIEVDNRFLGPEPWSPEWRATRPPVRTWDERVDDYEKKLQKRSWF